MYCVLLSTALINMTPENTTAITKSLIDTKVLTTVYKDLARPGVQQVGQALATVLGLGNTVLLPIKLLNEKANALFSNHMEKYRQRLADIPAENIIEVAPEIGVPIIEKLEKTSNETISELYINLLANASNVDTVDATHPRFIPIIESLTSDEAKILESFRDPMYTPFITLVLNQRKVSDGDIIRIVNKQATLFEINDILSIPKNSKFYFKNLEGLSLIESYKDRQLVGNAYDALLKHFDEEINKPQDSPEASITVEKGWYGLTEFGDMFLTACINNSHKAE